MRVRVQLFARLREIAGTSEWAGDLPDGASVADVWRALEASHPGIAALRPTVSCAVNAEFASMRATVRDGDEIAFLPPVSGGAN